MIDTQEIFNFILVLARVSAFVAFFPLFSRRQIPNLVKSGLAMSLSLFWYGSLPEQAKFHGQINVVVVTLQLIKELGLGYVLATLVGFFLMPARIAGAYIGQEIGLSLAAVTSPNGDDASTVLATIFEILATLILFGLNLHHVLIMLLHTSFMELGGQINLLNLPFELLTQYACDLTESGNVMIGPVGICLFALTIGLALLNKAAPTMNLFSVGMSLRAGIGLLCLFLFFPIILHSMEMYFENHTLKLQEFLQYFTT